MILAVCGGKGGVGKSTVSLNLGRELDAVVVDADLSTPDLPWGRGPDLHDVLADRAAPAEAVEELGSVEMLPCGRTLAGARAADLEALEDAVDLVDRQFGRVVVDCPAGLASDVGHQLFSADAAVLVTTPSRAAIQNALRTHELAKKVDAPVVATVLNKTTGDDDEIIAERLEREVGAPTHTVAKREELAEAQERWHPVGELYPDCPAADAFAAVAETVADCEREIRDRVGRT